MKLIYNNHKYELVELKEPDTRCSHDCVAIFEQVEDGEVDGKPVFKFGHLVHWFFGSDEDVYSAALYYIKDYENERKLELEKPQWEHFERGKTEHTGIYSVAYIDRDGSSISESVREDELEKRLNIREAQGYRDFCITEIEKNPSKEAEKKVEGSEDHYCDGFVEVLNAKNLCMWVMTNTHGESKAIAYDDNFYTPRDLLDAYRKLTKEDNAPEESFRKWLLTDCGCEPELLED